VKQASSLVTLIAVAEVVFEFDFLDTAMPRFA